MTSTNMSIKFNKYNIYLDIQTVNSVQKNVAKTYHNGKTSLLNVKIWTSGVHSRPSQK